jgi:hypothetical protein
MAHLVARSEPAIPVFYNIDGAVGAAPAANHREDVLLVQFAFAAMAASPMPETSMEFYRSVCEVRPTGTIDLATVNAIKAMQIEVKRSKPDTIINGRISPASGNCCCSGSSYTIMNLNEFVQHSHIDLWPRIDKIPGCPLELKQMVVRTVQGSHKA